MRMPVVLAALALALLARTPRAAACEGACCNAPKATLRVLAALEAGALLSLDVPTCEEENPFIRRVREKAFVALFRAGAQPSLSAVEVAGLRHLSPNEALHGWSRPAAHRKLLTDEEADTERWELPKGRDASELALAKEQWPVLRHLRGELPERLDALAVHSSPLHPFHVVQAARRFEYGTDDRGPWPLLLPVAKASALSVTLVDGIGPGARAAAEPVRKRVAQALARAGFAKVADRRAKEPHALTRAFVRPLRLDGAKDLDALVRLEHWYDEALQRLDTAVFGAVVPTNHAVEEDDQGRPKPLPLVPVADLTWDEGADVVFVLGDDLAALAARRLPAPTAGK